jgi:hypothetical protein
LFTLAARASFQVDFVPGVDDLYRCAVTNPSSMIRVSFARFNHGSGNDSDLNGYGETR